MIINIKNYLESFGEVSSLSRKRLLDEMDSVWDGLGLDNSVAINKQLDKVAVYYSHPVWILNGLFSECDPESRSHRVAIATFIKKLGVKRVADYGGGSGVLARLVTEAATIVHVNIVEPYANDFFVVRLSELPRITFVPRLGPDYDVVIAQDILEHVDNPLELAVELIQATHMNGYLIFANCFYPDIKCHLPATFYLRHTFIFLMRCAGLKFIGGIVDAKHALVFQRVEVLNRPVFDFASKQAKLIGPLLNWAMVLMRRSKSLCKKVTQRFGENSAAAASPHV